MQSSKPNRRRLGREALRAWYAPRRDAYPWRGSHDPYAVWVSEVMLQQTQASRVVPALRVVPAPLPDRPSARRRSTTRRRRANGVASATTGAPSGSRKPPESIVRDHGGRIPHDPDELLELPGVGPYTAAAVASPGVRRAGRGRRHQRAAGRLAGASRDRGSRGAREGGVGARRGVAGPRRPRHVEPGADGSRPGGVSTRTPMRRLPARRRLPVPPRWSGCEPRAEAARTVRGVDPTGAGRGGERVAITPLADACAARLGDRVPGRSCRCGGRNAFGRRARRGRCRACPAGVVICLSLS